jgi:hypothetical protein
MRLNILTNPIEYLDKAEFVPVHRSVDERAAVNAFDLNVKAVTPQKNIGCGEGDPLIAVNEAVVISQRLHQSGRFFLDGVVVPGLRAKNGGLNGTLIADTMETAEDFDQSMLHPVDFGYREVIRHLFGKTLQQISVASN